MLFAYADPPYPGRAYYYKRESSYAGEVDHKELVDRLVAQYPDGWALSTSSPSLADILPLCPEDVRVMAWVKPFASFKVDDLYPGTSVLRRCVDQRNRQLRLGQHEPVLAQDELIPG